jgi:predicted NACHT family NTPase
MPVLLISDLTEALDGKKLMLLMDGLDEIKSDYVENFEKDLDVFIKTWSETPVIITSRPINQFISYNKFLLCDIQPLEKEQSVELIEELECWDTEVKKNFIEALKNRLYESHRQFASNPLLLTIMLMTYSTFGEIPAKMHVFYSKAYETMSRLHDATKGSFKRKMHTKLSPEDFTKYFAEFCARTYRDQIIEFDKTLFCSYMSKVMERAPDEHAKIQLSNFRWYLIDYLCIFYKE